MANILQKFFRPEYQWRLLDIVEQYEITESFHKYDTQHMTPCGHPVFGTGSERKYSITTGDTFVLATRKYDSTYRHPISVRLYVQRKRTDGDKRISEHSEENTAFAYKIYGQMRDKYIGERQFTW